VCSVVVLRPAERQPIRRVGGRRWHVIGGVDGGGGVAAGRRRVAQVIRTQVVCRQAQVVGGAH